MNVIVIGGGPAGMMAAIASAENGNNVILLEKKERLGRKLLITGKGRCNITSSLPIEEFIQNIPGNGQFLYSAFKNYTNNDIINFLNEQGLDVKEERGNRIFPVTDKSLDVLKSFTKKLKELNVKIEYNMEVTEIVPKDENGKLKVKTVENKENNRGNINNRDKNKNNIKIFEADKVILATGGKSYPLTGSTGDGYELAKKLGHTVTKIRPSLVPLEAFEQNMCKDLQGLSLRNVNIELKNKENNKIIYQDFGEMLFTHFGVSGPIILSSSAHLVRYKNIEEKRKKKINKIKKMTGIVSTIILVISLVIQIAYLFVLKRHNYEYVIDILEYIINQIIIISATMSLILLTKKEKTMKNSRR